MFTAVDVAQSDAFTLLAVQALIEWPLRNETAGPEKLQEQAHGLDRAREGLINSRFHSEICFSGDPQVKFGGHPLIRGPIHGRRPPSDGPWPPPAPRSLRPCHEPPPRDIEIRQPAADIQPVRILRQPGTGLWPTRKCA